MKLLQAADATRLSGLSMHQLREWCIRRRLVLADVEPAGPGRHALYSWRTILVLRVLRELSEKFSVEIGQWGNGCQALQEALARVSFPSLWGVVVQFSDCKSVRLCEPDGPLQLGIQIPLDPHLEVIASGLELPTPPQQPSLFSAMVVHR